MPYRNMSLEDFARYIGMDAREVAKQVDRGRLPGTRVGGEWRFNRAKVTEWLQQEMPSFDPQRLEALDRAMGDRLHGQDEELIVTSLMGVEGIELDLQARTRQSVLRELVRLAERTGLLYDGPGLLASLQEREEMCSTALQLGVAIPHPRQPMPYVSAEPMICFARLGAAIGYGAPDGRLTDLFFLILSHEDRQHLQVLARLVRLLDEETIQALRETPDAAQALQLFISREQTVIGRHMSA